MPLIVENPKRSVVHLACSFVMPACPASFLSVSIDLAEHEDRFSTSGNDKKGNALFRSREVLIYTLLLACLFLTGCASVTTQKEWEGVKEFAREHTGADIRWEQTKEDEALTAKEINELLADGLKEDEAVRIALLNNRRLQASFEEIGAAKADLVQAGLFSNPNLSAIFRFPFGGGGTDIEAEGIINISDLWQIPLRKKTASARLETTTLRIAEEILNTAAEAKHAHSENIALAHILAEMKNMKKQLEELRDHLIYRREFGLTKDVDIDMANSEVLGQEAEIARIEKELHFARLRLNRVLGLSPDQLEYEIMGSLPEQFEPLPDSEALISHAMAVRPDVRIST
ncbi:MAG: TolC family protein [Nitrospirota bacterium]